MADQDLKDYRENEEKREEKNSWCSKREDGPTSLGAGNPS